MKRDRPLWYWERFTDGSGSWVQQGREPSGPPGEELAALRSGLGRAAGTVPRMWPFYVADIPEGTLHAYRDEWRPPARLEAEHHALTLYGMHQQSKQRPVHQSDVGFGHAARTLRQSDKFSEEAVDRRFGAAATATTVSELVSHMRRLVSQMRALDQLRTLDYSQLLEDLHGWTIPERQQQIRRRWGGQYYAWPRSHEKDGGQTPESEPDAVATPS